MWLWAFMTIVVLFTPLLMILLGNHIYKKPPEEISEVYGYRTPVSYTHLTLPTILRV